MAEALADHRGLDVLHARAYAAGWTPPLDRFLFLRHGRTRGNAERILQHPEIPLDEHGLAEALRAGEALRDGPFTHIVASDMARAWRTAGAVAAASRRPVHVERGLRERYFGDWIGSSSAGLDWNSAPPNGETLDGFVERTLDGLTAALATGPTPLLVSHGGVLHVLAGALGIALGPALLANALPLEVARAPAGWAITPLA